MKTLFAIITIIFLSLQSFAQRVASPEETKEYLRKSDSIYKAKKAREDAYWDSINNKGLQDHKAAMIKKYGVKTGTKIANGEIEMGFTKTMCQEAWGNADTERTDGKKESIYYRKMRTALTFTNGKLVKITEL